MKKILLLAIAAMPVVAFSQSIELECRRSGIDFACVDANDNTYELDFTRNGGWFSRSYDLSVTTNATQPDPDPIPDPDPVPDPVPDPTPDPDPDPIPDPDPAPDPDPPPSSYRGIPDPSAALGFDVRASYSIDQTLSGSQGNKQVSCNGSASDPCVIDLRAANFTGLGVTGSYVIVQGGKINAPRSSGPFLHTAGCDKCVLRDVDLIGPKTDQGHSTAVWVGDNTVWLDGSVHGFGDNRASAREQDFHGFKIQARNVWILGLEAYDLSGDAVQCGDATRGRCDNVYIGGGNFHDNRENGVDIKDSRNVVVSGNTMSGFSGNASDPGAAIVIHDDAFDAKIYDNKISNARIGVVTSGISGHQITGNTIQATFRGIECRNTRNVVISGNGIVAPTAVERQSGCSGTIQ